MILMENSLSRALYHEMIWVMRNQYQLPFSIIFESLSYVKYCSIKSPTKILFISSLFRKVERTVKHNSDGENNFALVRNEENSSKSDIAWMN